MFVLLPFLTSFALAEPAPKVMESVKENSEEVLLETEVSRTERAERMKKILQEVRKDLSERNKNQKKSQAPKSDDNTGTN